MIEPRPKRDPEGTRRRILEAATQQFASYGLAGARIDAIATAAETNERMLYYYFGSKEGLYVAVLEAMYSEFAKHEVRLDLAGMSPAAAVRALAFSIWDTLKANPHWITLINNENLHSGQYVQRSPKLQDAISPLVEVLNETLKRGAADGDFRANVDPLDFYVTLVGMGYYVLSNRFTLKAFVGRDYAEPGALNAVTAMHAEMLLSYLRTSGALTSTEVAAKMA